MLTLEEVAKRLRVSKRSVYRLIWSKKLRAVRVGGMWRFREKDLEAFKREGQNEAR